MSALCLVSAAVMLASCAAQSPKASKTPRSKEYFPESVYGVKASPKVVSDKRSRIPRGGGRDQLGKPYQVKGNWYHPKEDPNYFKIGAASWYGDAFHGRLTANGEVYDMTHLTAAHPTMPLPSYARVTNISNGHSVLVRVNDRGPFERGRVIDLSKRAAEMLDYAHAGVARVKVEYVGRAPLDGHDDSFLMASYRPGPGAPPIPGAPGPDEVVPGVMIAMAGPTPSAPVRAAVPLPAPSPVAAASAPAPVAIDFELPALGPAVPERPVPGIEGVPVLVAALSYAPERLRADPFTALERGPRPEEIVASWRRQTAGRGADTADYVAAGTFQDRAQAERLAGRLSALGRVEIVVDFSGDVEWHTLDVHPDGRAGTDTVLRAAWDAGASDAMTVRR